MAMRSPERAWDPGERPPAEPSIDATGRRILLDVSAALHVGQLADVVVVRLAGAMLVSAGTRCQPRKTSEDACMRC